jgi:hypothetical protein
MSAIWPCRSCTGQRQGIHVCLDGACAIKDSSCSLFCWEGAKPASWQLQETDLVCRPQLLGPSPASQERHPPSRGAAFEYTGLPRFSTSPRPGP